MTQGNQFLQRRGNERTVALSMATVSSDCGQKTVCLGVVKDGDKRAADVGVDSKVHAAAELLRLSARGRSVRWWDAMMVS